MTDLATAVFKLLRSIDTVELIDTGTPLDSTNRAEKRGIIDSVERLRALKDLRNEIAHEYETNDLSVLFEAVLKAVPVLFGIAERIQAYCTRYADVPEGR